MHLHFFWNFQWDMFIPTIYFIALNVYVEFVLIYRPHPVHCPSIAKTKTRTERKDRVSLTMIKTSA